MLIRYLNGMSALSLVDMICGVWEEFEVGGVLDVCFECVVVEPDGADDCWLAPVVVDGEEDVVVEHTLDVFDDCCRVTVVC